MDLAATTAIVTGAAVGTGRAIAERLAAKGARPRQQRRRRQPLPPHFPDATPAQWGATLDLNLRAAMLATQLALEPMRRAGGGAIVNTASTAGLGCEAYESPEYGAAKAGLIRFTAAFSRARRRPHQLRRPELGPHRAAEGELAAMAPEERAAAPEPIPLEALTDAVIDLIRDEASAGRVVVLRGRG